MNLFLLGWQQFTVERSQLEREMRAVGKIYPQLDPSSLRVIPIAPGVWATTLQHAPAVCAPRRYVSVDAESVTLYDGCVVDGAAEFDAHDAASLATNWSKLPGRLEGQFVIAQLRRTPPEIELMGDLLGFHQVYVARHGGGWLVSNSIGLLERMTGNRAPDPKGTSLFLAIGWTGGDSTLMDGVHTMPGGERWVWRHDRSDPERVAYSTRTALKAVPRLRLNRQAMEALVDRLTAPCRALAAAHGAFDCALTGGRDSRLLLGLLQRAGLAASYYTSGAPGCSDIEIARRIASRYGFPHEVRVQSAAQVDREWQAAARRLVGQTDGLVSLMQIADVCGQRSRVDRLPIGLWGIGGEIARGHFSYPGIFVRRCGRRAIVAHLLDMVHSDHGGLLSSETGAQARAHVEAFAARALDEGFAARDIPDLYYAFDRVPRWAGSNARKAQPTGDRYSPFLSRAFLEASFGLSAAARHAEALHSRLIRMVDSELHRVQLTDHPWRPERPTMHALRWAFEAAGRRAPAAVRRFLGHRQRRETPAHDHLSWLDARRGWIRELCLGQSDSPLWHFVDRKVFEHATAPSAPAAAWRSRAQGLYRVATVFLRRAMREP